MIKSIEFRHSALLLVTFIHISMIDTDCILIFCWPCKHCSCFPSINNSHWNSTSMDDRRCSSISHPIFMHNTQIMYTSVHPLWSAIVYHIWWLGLMSLLNSASYHCQYSQQSREHHQLHVICAVTVLLTSPFPWLPAMMITWMIVVVTIPTNKILIIIAFVMTINTICNDVLIQQHNPFNLIDHHYTLSTQTTWS